VLATHVKSLTHIEITIVLILAIVVLAVCAVYGSTIWFQQQHPSTTCSLLLRTYKAQCEGVHVYIEDAKAIWRNNTLVATLNIQPPNPCTKVDTVIETLKMEREVRVTVVVNVTKPPPGTFCIEVLPPPIRHDIAVPLKKETGYKVVVYAKFISADKVLAEKPILRAAVVCTKNNPTIKEILDRPQEHKGKTITLNAVYTGWQPPQNLQGPSIATPPLTRSDWTIADSTAWIYVAANSPAKPALDPIRDWGIPLTIVGKVETISINDVTVPYIIALEITTNAT